MRSRLSAAFGRLTRRPPAATRASRIIVTGDVLRPGGNRFAPSQHKNIRWLYHLLRLPLARATGLPVECVSWGQPFPTEEYYTASSADLSLDGWARIYGANEVSVEALSIINHAFAGALVVGYELPLVFTRALEILRVTWVDLSIHPVRFLPDLMFAFSTNHPEILLEAARDHRASYELEPWAALLVATSTRQPQAKLPSKTALVVGQVFGDRSLIQDGRFLDLSCFSELVRNAAKNTPITFKPHPYQRSDFGLMTTGVPFKDISLTTEPMYALLAHEDVAEVVTVSSSVGIEAPFFGKPVKWLGTSPFRIASDRQNVGPQSHLSIGYRILHADFWRRVLQPVVPTTKADGAITHYPPNTLRMSLKNFWGYNQLTTDHLIDAWRDATLRRVN